MLSLNLMVFASGAAGVWLDVPFVKQDKNACGAASIAMVMQYWQRQQREPADVPDSTEIQRSIYSDQAHGIYASEMEHYLKQHGYRTFAFRGRIDDIKDHLEKGRPLIVALKPSAGGRNAALCCSGGIGPGCRAGVEERSRRAQVTEANAIRFRKRMEGRWQLDTTGGTARKRSGFVSSVVLAVTLVISLTCFGQTSPARGSELARISSSFSPRRSGRKLSPRLKEFPRVTRN